MKKTGKYKEKLTSHPRGNEFRESLGQVSRGLIVIHIAHKPEIMAIHCDNLYVFLSWALLQCHRIDVANLGKRHLNLLYQIHNQLVSS